MIRALVAFTIAAQGVGQLFILVNARRYWERAVRRTPITNGWLWALPILSLSVAALSYASGSLWWSALMLALTSLATALAFALWKRVTQPQICYAQAITRVNEMTAPDDPA